MKVKDSVVVITPQRIYLFTRDYHFIESRPVRDITQIIMIRTNPSMMALCSEKAQPILLQTFRRPELSIFVIT